MTSIKELARRRDALVRARAIKNKKASLKREIFSLKYGGLIGVAKSAGSVVAKGAKGVGKAGLSYAEYYQGNATRRKKSRKNDFYMGSGSLF